jgi:preprotein translocase subunit SecG
MEVVLTVIVFASSIVLIVSVLLQEGRDAGMGSAVGGTIEVLFGKAKSRGMQPMLQRITIYSSVVFMLSVLIMGLVLRAAS